MPDRETYHTMVSRVVADNSAADYYLIHWGLHEGKYEAALNHAIRMGLHTPPGEPPPASHKFPLSDRQRQLLLDTFATHQPTESGFPDHLYEPEA